MTTFTNLVNLLRYRAEESANKTAYTFLKDGEYELGSSTYSQIDEKARAIAAMLQSNYTAGQRALLVFNPGLDYIAAFWGCLYAGIVAVPAYPPQSRKHDAGRLDAIIQDAGIDIVLTGLDILETIQTCLSDQHSLLIMDEIPLNAAHNWLKPSINSNQLAFLQYTSGSTAQPKGVMISHANLLHNLAIISRCLQYTADDIMVSWLPPYHDMGLIAGILSPIYNGAQAIGMSPQAFLQSPFRWLKTISDYRATLSGAPNFAYEHCIKNITAAQKQQLDLSTWRVAANGAETVRANTIENFYTYFASCGLSRQTLFPCYGLAESTVYVSGKSECTPLKISRRQLELNLVAPPENPDDEKIIVSSGIPAFEQQLCIVDPATLTVCEANQIGEIWLQGDSVAAGYWNQPELNQEVFQAHLANDLQSGVFLRTGDWGFLNNNQELYVTGRMKEMMIINGRNHYPQDIMRNIQAADSAFRIDGGSAFTVEIANEERLVVVQEVERAALRDLNSEKLFSAIRQVISSQHGLKVYGIILIKPLWLPRTSSGKIQHYRAKLEYLQDTLKSVATWHETDIQQAAPNKPDTASSRKADTLITWLRAYAAKRINSRLIDERRCILPHIVLDFGNQGILGMSVPEELGGLGMANQDIIRVVSQLSAIDSTLGAFVGIQNSLGVLPILNYANAEKKAALLPVIASGRELASFALTEEAAGSDPKSIKTTATPDEKRGGWLINGKKIWIGNAAWASVFNVFVQLMDEQGNPQGITGFVVRQEAEGVLSGEEAMTMGVRGMVQNAILLNNVHVTEADLLGEIGQGFTIAQETMQYARLGIAASALGGMQRCLQFMYQYASRRQISTGLLLNNPVTLAKISQASIAIVSIEALVTTIAELRDSHIDIPDEIYLVCKTSAPELAYQVVDDTMQLLGGRGYCENNLVPQLFRDIRLLRIFEGPTETLNMYLGSLLIHHPERLYSFLEQVLNVTEITEELKICIAKLETQAKESPSFSDRLNAVRWQQSCLGELATQLVIKAFLIYFSRKYQRENKKIRITQAIKHCDRHFRHQLEKMLHFRSGDIIENDQFIDAFMAEIKNNVGETEFTGYGEDHQLDDYLRRDNASNPSFINTASDKRKKTTKALEIEQWIIQWLSRYLQIEASYIDANTLLIEYGIDSISAVELARDLETQFSLTLNSNVVWNFPNVGDLADYIESRLAE